MTRAKSTLRIGYKDEYLKKIVLDLGGYQKDDRVYGDPQKISLTLGLSQVNLGVFLHYQHEIAKLMPGEELRYDGSGLLGKNNKYVLRFANSFKQQLENYGARKFVVDTARVTYVVYWWDEENAKDVKVVLPEVVMVKKD